MVHVDGTNVLPRLDPEEFLAAIPALLLIEHATQTAEFPLFVRPEKEAWQELFSRVWSVGYHSGNYHLILDLSEGDILQFVLQTISTQGSGEALRLLWDETGCIYQYSMIGPFQKGQPLCIGWLAKEISPNTPLFEKRHLEDDEEVVRVIRLMIHAFKQVC